MYNIIIKKSAKKYIQKQSTPAIKRIMIAIESLAENPFSGEALTNQEAQYRLRVGDYRILYDIYKTKVTVEVVKVGPRGDVYN